MKNYQIILNNSDGSNDVVWVKSGMKLNDIEYITGKTVTTLLEEWTEIDGIDGEFPIDFPELLLIKEH